MQQPGVGSRESRPLSPHLTIYRPQITTVLSILHRITGFGLYVGLILAALWTMHLGFYGNGGFVGAFFTTRIGKLFLFFWTLALFYHLANGIRHLFWDAGKGYALPVATRSGYAVVVSAAVLTGVCWLIAFFQ
jgi:succinate dehydrogenase / fumarate reductase cytochrome b subunit